ncbi:MAG: DUF4037 domain-containing protein [Roseburia sp.]|nr:DUF4037 domain-containing protein [Roseburia sp.]MCM1242332.1 DUF4037 domain-containing protein [Roseburia sp.]
MKTGKDTIVENLFNELCSLEQVEALALGGSRAGEYFDEASDYDVYLYCTGSVPEAVRQEILSHYCSVMEIGNQYWETEDNCRLTSGVDIDILYRGLDDFTAGIAAVVEAFEAHNGYTTCMWHNLLTCKILYDRDGRLGEMKKRFSVPYPERLKENIICRNWNLVHAAMPAYDGQIKKAVGRGDIISVNHRTAAFLESYFDILFALNGVTHPGEKRMIQMCLERCSLLPERFEENLQRLLHDLYTAPQRTAEDLESIVAALEKILNESEVVLLHIR